MLGSPGSPVGSGGRGRGAGKGHLQRLPRLVPTPRLHWAQIYYVRFRGKKNKTLQTAASEPSENNGNHSQELRSLRPSFWATFESPSVRRE